MYWYDGQLIEQDQICLPLTEPGLIYGATVFTTLRVYQQSLEHPLTQWEAHCHRLEHSLKDFAWTLPSWPQLRQGAKCLIPHYPVLRLTIFPDGREWIMGRFLPEDLAASQRQGIRAWVANHSLFQRTLNAYKTGNYLGPWLALQKAQSLGFREAILVNSQGNWLESSTGNLWGYKAGKWYTPSLEDGILPGIGRSQLISWLSNQKIEINESQWTLEWVKELEIIAYTNSVVEIIPFSQIVLGEKQLVFDVSHRGLQQLKNYYQL
ncbi:aminotransferase class IV [Crocosphaera sp. UHCC 0190]|uniref:aminotransferase class IV n=1 Tax=Crocosphaera sp. UHCC 0190 TaxID=3110246 RepID=UPI002B202CE0|nr:aminotransferase class IV [Crocosphaera sp. UHCC 0190]MEA5511487.1 aminotransferase class IV [Crocosphaera sp. UHCC 0190]